MIHLWYEKAKITLKINKPRYVGICILDLSKVLMYSFYYDYINNKYSSKSRLLFTCTNSLMHEIKAADFYEDFGKDKMFDFSNYLTKSKFYDELLVK